MMADLYWDKNGHRKLYRRKNVLEDFFCVYHPMLWRLAFEFVAILGIVRASVFLRCTGTEKNYNQDNC